MVEHFDEVGIYWDWNQIHISMYWYLLYLCSGLTFGPYVCIWNLNYFFSEKSTVGAVLDWTTLTNTHSRGGWWYNRPYRSPLQGRLKTPAAPTEKHCRGGQETAPTEAPSIGTPWEGRLAQPPQLCVFVRTVQSRTAPTVDFSEKKIIQIPNAHIWSKCQSRTQIQ